MTWWNDYSNDEGWYGDEEAVLQSELLELAMIIGAHDD